MQPCQQRDEVEVFATSDDELAIEHEPLVRQRQQGVDDLGEVARERPLVAAAQVNLAAIAEREAAEAVPLRLVEVVAARQLAREPRQHRREGLHGQHICEVPRSSWAETFSGSALRRDRKCTRSRSDWLMANPVPAGSDVSAGTYRCTSCGNEIEVGSTKHLPPCPSCGNGEYETVSGGDSTSDPYPNQ